MMKIYQDGELIAENKMDAFDKRVEIKIMPHISFLVKAIIALFL